jgi:hypothetical protein
LIETIKSYKAKKGKIIHMNKHQQHFQTTDGIRLLVSLYVWEGVGGDQETIETQMKKKMTKNNPRE